MNKICTSIEQSKKLLELGIDVNTIKYKITMATIKEEFKKLYGNREIELPSHIITINDSYTSPFSSGSNGYLTKVRLNKEDNFEFYHDWWEYGWISFDEVKEKYPCAACKIESLINYLIK